MRNVFFGIPCPERVQKTSRRVGLLIIGTSILLSCSSHKPPPALPQGEQELQGVLERTSVSIHRRGSHLLLQEGEELSYVESRLVSLGEFEGKEVLLRGTFEYNTLPSDLPVLVVREVEAVNGRQRLIRIPQLTMSLEIPGNWSGTREGTSLHFTKEKNSSPLLMLSVDTSPLPSSGFPITLGGKQALRLLDETNGEQEIHMQHKGQHLTILFTPEHQANPEEARREFLGILRSISFGEKEEEAPADTGIGHAGGKPCGGVAGVLCAPFEYCEITDIKENIGQCRTQR